MFSIITNRVYVFVCLQIITLKINHVNFVKSYRRIFVILFCFNFDDLIHFTVFFLLVDLNDTLKFVYLIYTLSLFQINTDVGGKGSRVSCTTKQGQRI